MSEEWRKIPGYDERFEVSDLGRVRTQPHTYVRVDPTRGRVEVRLPGRILKQTAVGSGYRTVNTGSQGKCRNALVHVLVARAFLGKPKSGQEVNHKNGLKADNRLSNLEWVTRGENVEHSHRVLGRKAPSSCRRIEAKLVTGETKVFESLSAAARHFNVTPHAVSTWVSGQFKNRFGAEIRELS